MAIDAFFSIGKQHQKEGVPCQDYALVSDKQFPTLVVCDGCSGARARTDIGARMLALAFEEKAPVLATAPEQFFAELLTYFQQIKVGTIRDNLATIIGGVVLPDCFRFFLMGDGVLTISFKDGSKTFYDWSWVKNAPFYLAYHLEQDAIDQFIQETVGQDEILESVLETRVSLNAAGEVISEASQWKSLRQFQEGFRMDIPLAEVQAIACFSDGLLSFYKEVEGGQFQHLANPAAVQEFTGFKNYAGQFVTRRTTRGLQSMAKDGYLNYDDIGVAAWSAE